MRIVTAVAFVSDLQMDSSFVYTSGRAGFERGFTIRAWVAFHKNLLMFPIHVSFQIAIRRTAESAKVTLLPILLVVDLVVDDQTVLVWTLEITLPATECSSIVLGFGVIFQLAWDVCSVVTHMTHQVLIWGLQTMNLISVA